MVGSAKIAPFVGQRVYLPVVPRLRSTWLLWCLPYSHNCAPNVKYTPAGEGIDAPGLLC